MQNWQLTFTFVGLFKADVGISCILIAWALHVYLCSFLGLGVDDMFVIIEAWNNLTRAQKKNDIATRVAIAMKHAGVSITVTSITDFVAFAIGASTVSNLLGTLLLYKL